MEKHFTHDAGLWGICNDDAAHEHLARKPVLGCVTIKLNGKTVASRQKLLKIETLVAKLKARAQCPHTPWKCTNGDISAGCRRSCEEETDIVVSPPDNGEPPSWDCAEGWTNRNDWTCFGEGDEAKCQRKCFRMLEDEFRTDNEVCKLGYYFHKNGSWRCNTADGECKR
jgi:hypothetical protein